MSEYGYPICAIIVIALVTMSLRAFPFLIFGQRPLPGAISYLGKYLPPAIMTVLVFYCLKNVCLTQPPFGAAQLLPCLLVVVLQVKKGNMYVSIVAGTLCHMLLLRVL